MARKSRKDTIRTLNAGLPLPEPETVTAESTVYQTAAYARLSVLETRDREDGEALQNQKALLRDFIARQPELQFRTVYEDNGRTGTNFDRLGFQTLMADVRMGKINCIVVKDLSRFGRDHAEADEYLEHIFPRIGVRFISIGDGYDSIDPSTIGCLKVALKNLFNQVYSEDISRKSGSVLREKIKRGEFIGAYASYGYIKDPEDRHHIVIDPEAATVVQEIFRRKSSGESNSFITRWLNESGILSPCTYRYQKGISLDRRFAEGKPWMIGTVKEILRNQVYLGHMVQGRRRSEFYAGRPDRMLPQSEWTVVEHTHEAIVDRETFDRVQAILAEKSARYHESLGKYDYLGKSENILKGLVFCADCGRPLVRYKQVSHGKRVEYFYICPNYAAQLARSGCTYKYVPESALKELVCRLIDREARLSVDTAALLKKRAEGCGGGNAAQELRRASTELARLEGLKTRLMQDYLADLLTLPEYEHLKERYQAEGESLALCLDELKEKQGREGEIYAGKNPWSSAFSRKEACGELTRELVQALVERIIVHSSERAEVVFHFRDERQAVLDAVAEKGDWSA